MRSGDVAFIKFMKNFFSFRAGFSLIEVMIAIMVLSMFASAFLVSQGLHVSESRQMQDELILQNLCQLKIKKIFLEPPEFTESLGDKVAETGNFSEEGFPSHTFSVEYKKMTLPELDKIEGKSAEEKKEEEASNAQSSAMKKAIFGQFKKHIESKMWQVRVTVKEKKSGLSFSLSALITNEKAPDMNLGSFLTQ